MDRPEGEEGVEGVIRPEILISHRVILSEARLMDLKGQAARRTQRIASLNGRSGRGGARGKSSWIEDEGKANGIEGEGERQAG